MSGNHNKNVYIGFDHKPSSYTKPVREDVDPRIKELIGMLIEDFGLANVMIAEATIMDDLADAAHTEAGYMNLTTLNFSALANSLYNRGSLILYDPGKDSN